MRRKISAFLSGSYGKRLTAGRTNHSSSCEKVGLGVVLSQKRNRIALQVFQTIKPLAKSKFRTVSRKLCNPMN